MKKSFMFFCFLVVSTTLVFSENIDRFVLDSYDYHQLSTDWVILSDSLEDDYKVTFDIHVKQQNLDQLESKFWDISNPRSENYAKYLNMEEIIQIIRPREDHFNSVMKWLESYGVFEPAVYGGKTIRVTFPASIVEEMFQTNLVLVNDHRSVQEHHHVPRVSFHGELSVPKSLEGKIDMIGRLRAIKYFKAGHKHSGVGSVNPLERSARVSRSVLESSEALMKKRKEMERKEMERKEMEEEVKRVEAGSNKFALPGFDLPSLNGSATYAGSPPCVTNNTCTDASGNDVGCCSSNSTCCFSPAGAICCPGGLKCCAGECKDQCDVPPHWITPEVLRQTYTVPQNELSQSDGNKQSVTAFVDEYTTGGLAYMKGFFKEPGVGVTRVGNKSCLDEACDQYESDLDIQYQSSMGKNVSQWFWYMGGENEYTLEWAQEVLNTTDPPYVHSISYIAGEYMLGPLYINQSNVEFIKMGLMGLSVMACSGDTGTNAWSINFPIVTTGLNFPFPCENCTTAVNYCSQVQFTNSTGGVCSIPSGLYSRDPGLDARCNFINGTVASETLANFTSIANDQGCGLSIVSDDSGYVRVFSENCTCDQLPSVTSSDGTIKITGFKFDVNNGFPFTPLYPASSPYITAVGATQEQVQCPQNYLGVDIPCNQGEIVSSIGTGSRITSGGGFSTLPLQAQPSYQTAFVSKYFASNVTVPPHAYYNTTQRGYPDVAFNGKDWLVGGTFDPTSEQCPCGLVGVDGTSCSSPGFSGLISLLNDLALRENNALLGFLNPLLYQMAADSPDIFNDVVDGSTHCTEEVCGEWGFKAIEGWDPATGLGTVSYAAMKEYLFEMYNG